MKSPELPTRSMMGAVVWTAMKIIRNWKVMRELLTRDFRSGENHSAAVKEKQIKRRIIHFQRPQSYPSVSKES